ncbi:MAG: DUF5069 domain-containing protein [Gemmatimonadota bacterium]
MSDSQSFDFKPRARGLIIGGIPWLARITDKARAKLTGRIGAYIYPCPADQRFLQDVEMAAEEFTALVADCPDDGAVIARMKAHLATKAKAD